MSNAILGHGRLLGVFALVSCGVIALTNWATSDRIAQQTQQTLIATLNSIMPQDRYNNAIAEDCVMIAATQAPALFGLNEHSTKPTNKAVRIYRARLDNAPAGLAVETFTPNGYNGTIKLLVAVLKDGQIGGARVLAHRETPGLGDKIEERISPWITQFSGYPTTSVNQAMWAVQKDGGRFDQFTGATITPRAVVLSIKVAVQYLDSHWQEAFAMDNQCGEN